MNKELEEYKLLIDIYYKEVNLFYSKTTIFITIQLAMFSAVIAGYNILVGAADLFCIGIMLMMLLSVIQILISMRGYTVNEALIHTLAEFEEKHDFTLLRDFTNNTKRVKKISRMNFPSYMMVFINILFFLSWSVILIIVIFPFIKDLLLSIDYNEQLDIIRIIVLCIFSMMYAVTMKISDLLDEHGLYLFKGAPYFFSFLCAIFGCLLIVFDNIIANIIFAMVMGFVIRKRIDYNNHILAFIIITSCFLSHSDLIINIYFPFLVIIILLGFLKDTKYKNYNSKIIKHINKIYLYVPIVYALPSLVYSIIYSNWSVFCVFFIYDLSYNITRLVGERGICPKGKNVP